METKIAWNRALVKAKYKGKFDAFYKLCKSQYKTYYKGVSKKDIEKEFEFLTR
ncbi:MAG: hypothetical protein QNK20_16535 [Aureibaculum sp.]|nr:hypothetical protein [Aureibaculum sp.]